MAHITFRYRDASPEVSVTASAGTSVMKAAVSNGVPGIIGECGGQLMCATCHVYVVDSPAPSTPGDDESDMLELAAATVEDASRLSCQLIIESDDESIIIDVPEVQL